MFDVKKLRKGNYVWYPEGCFEFMGDKFAIIEDAKKEHVELNNTREATITVRTTNGSETIMEKHADPIPLSVDWLLFLGFKEGVVSVLQDGISFDKTHYENGLHCVHVHEDGYCLLANGEGPINSLQYVHELQNLWQHYGLGSLTFEYPQ